LAGRAKVLADFVGTVIDFDKWVNARIVVTRGISVKSTAGWASKFAEFSELVNDRIEARITSISTAAIVVDVLRSWTRGAAETECVIW